MRIFLYHKDVLAIQERFKLDLMDCVSRVFGTLKGSITICELIQAKTLSIGGENYDYFCVVEDSTNDLNRNRNDFNVEINKTLSKQLATCVNGDSLLTRAFNKEDFEKTLGEGSPNSSFSGSEEYDYNLRSLNYVPTTPCYSFDRVILETETINKIIEAVNIIKYESLVFDEWGLRAIQPNPSSALSFFGPSGTGKTMAAEAVASMLGKKILKVGYADIESKYHGEGPKMVKAIFMAAERNDCVLFIDEADSLLSKRLTNVTQGSEQAINSMRSQLLICLEEFKGIVIFATNLVVNYDNAFLTRLISIEFKKPNAELRKKIWEVHLYPTSGNGLNIPLSNDINLNELAEKYDFCGREIRKAVVSACVKTAMSGKSIVEMSLIIEACEQIRKEEESLKASAHAPLNVSSIIGSEDKK